jgi:hypothetical protein
MATGSVRDLSAEELANAFYVAQQSHARRVADRVQQLWREIDRRDLSRSWAIYIGPEVVRTVTAGQLATAAAADAYVESIIAARGLSSDPAGRVRPEAFAGLAADGRSLDTLLDLPLITSKTAIAAGVDEVEAMMTGLQQLLRMAASEVTDAGRAATGVSIAGNRTINGYIRVVNPPACSRCIVLAGREYGWNTGFQRHPRCFPAGVVVSGPRSQAATRRWFQGELIVLSTASGQNLALTGNHPVLTSRGWVPANLIQEGDEVVRSTRPEGATPLVVPDHHEMPSLIEDVWGALSVHGLDRMPTATEDFHGDGQQGEVDVVYADRALASGNLATVGKKLVQLGLAGGLGLTGQFDAERASMLLNLWDATQSGGPVGGGGLGLALASAQLGRPDNASFTGVTPLYSGFREAARDDISGHPVLLAERELAGSIEVGGRDFTDGEIAGLPRWDAPGDSFSVETRDGYARQGRDLLDRLSGQVELDRVVELRRSEWSGHVYSLTSVEGWHVANSLIVSNCDCTHMPAKLIARDRHIPGAFDPQAYFKGLSRAEQDRIFTQAGAKAIRDGADMNSVVNARRGMYTAADGYGGRLRATYEGTTRRGLYFQMERSRAYRAGTASPRYPRRFQLSSPRLLPEQIYRIAGSRDEAISLLRQYGYLGWSV